MHFPVSMTMTTHSVPVLLAHHALSVSLIPASKQQRKIITFTSVAVTGNARWTVVNDTRYACIASVVDISDATFEPLPVSQCL
jgi:hypothetical protein